PYFAGAAILAFLLSRVGLPPRLSGVLLMAGALLLTMKVPADGGSISVVAALLGLLAFKLSDSMYLSDQSSLDDLIPAFCWLSGVLVLSELVTKSQIPIMEGALLGAISVAIMLHVMQGPFMHDDKI